ncbi:MAG: YkgJ family cysteine cluster protein [Pseudomonadota bacterium]
MKHANLKHNCRRCSKCCSYFCVEIDKPTTKSDFEDVAWMVAHEKVSVHVCKGLWHLMVKNRCKHLSKNGKCKVYEKRPMICRSHDPSECDFEAKTEHDYDDTENVFTTIDEVYKFRDKRFAKRRKKKKVVKKKVIKKR